MMAQTAKTDMSSLARNHGVETGVIDACSRYVILESDQYNWKNLKNYIVSFPPVLDNYRTYRPTDFYMIELVLEGKVQAEYKKGINKWIKVNKAENCLGIYTPHQAVLWRHQPLNSVETPLLISCVYLSSNFLVKTAIETLGIKPSLIDVKCCISHSDLFLKQLLLGIRKELEMGNPFGQIYSDIVSQMLSVHLLKNYCSIDFAELLIKREKHLSRNRLDIVIEYIDSNFHEDITLQQLSGLIDVSEFHLLRIFRNAVGISPLQYIINKRIAIANHLLETTDLSVTGIALEVGYTNISHFITLFKRVTGLTPARYRKKVKS